MRKKIIICSTVVVFVIVMIYMFSTEISLALKGITGVREEVEHGMLYNGTEYKIVDVTSDEKSHIVCLYKNSIGLWTVHMDGEVEDGIGVIHMTSGDGDYDQFSEYYKIDNPIKMIKKEDINVPDNSVVRIKRGPDNSRFVFVTMNMHYRDDNAEEVNNVDIVKDLKEAGCIK